MSEPVGECLESLDTYCDPFRSTVEHLNHIKTIETVCPGCAARSPLVGFVRSSHKTVSSWSALEQPDAKEGNIENGRRRNARNH